MAISRSEADSMSSVQVAVLEQAEGETSDRLGNPKLRRMSEFAVRAALRKALIGDKDALARWERWAADWSDREKTFAASQFRAFERGERGRMR